MTVLADLRTAIATAVNTGVAGIQASAVVVSNPTPPCAWVLPDEPFCDPVGAMHSGMETWQLVVECFVALATDRGATAKLDAMASTSGTSSIYAALIADRTLGGACADLQVTRLGGYGDYQLGERGAVLGFRAYITVYV